MQLVQCMQPGLGYSSSTTCFLSAVSPACSIRYCLVMSRVPLLCIMLQAYAHLARTTRCERLLRWLLLSAAPYSLVKAAASLCGLAPAWASSPV